MLQDCSFNLASGRHERVDVFTLSHLSSKWQLGVSKTSVTLSVADCELEWTLTMQTQHRYKDWEYRLDSKDMAWCF